MVSYVRCVSDLWPFIISTEDEIGALYLEYFMNNINGEDEIGTLYLEYFTNNINGCQITKERKKKKKRLVI
jgi:hypothetical protein